MDTRLVIRLGMSCNNNCKFCIFGIDKHKFHDKTERQIKEIIENNPEYKSVVFTGGDPCVRPDLIDLVKYANKRGFKEIQIQSNGRMFTYYDLCKRLINAGANEFAIAIHGHNSSVHDYLTSTKSSFDQSVQGIKNLKKLGQYVITNTVITKKNFKYLPKIALFLVGLDIEHFQFSFVHVIGRARENRDLIVPKKTDVIPYLKKAIDIGRKYGTRVTTEAIPYCLMPNYEDCVVENFIPKSKVFEMDFKINDLKRHRIYEKKSKRQNCKQCKHYHICEGPWKEYPELFSWDEFIPVAF